MRFRRHRNPFAKPVARREAAFFTCPDCGRLVVASNSYLLPAAVAGHYHVVHDRYMEVAEATQVIRFEEWLAKWSASESEVCRAETRAVGDDLRRSSRPDSSGGRGGADQLHACGTAA